MGADHLKLVSYCPMCEVRANPVDARALGRSGDTQLMHVTCRACSAAYLALVLAGRVGASCVGLMTDLTHDDAMRFARAGAIGIDDVIEMHTFLERKGWMSFVRPVKKPRVRARNPRRS